jgi:hypothetical protein
LIASDPGEEEMAMPVVLEGDVERFCDGMSGKPHIQAKIMSAVQDVEIERYRLEIKQLPASAQERMAFTHNELFAPVDHGMRRRDPWPGTP